ncbi:hypothetical protein SAMN05421505_103232 [Sinosporangium album]|uniref:Lipoprotein n=1 Tax=Sinosporangium album TaxID=504805 RepID=A0A1G7TEJ2_9ACTN|nr:hypothetical protein [Sinosporangium album]SDG33454.1 hypothetical protein SAMN05421505_103232 [Sinosporangium album]
MLKYRELAGRGVAVGILALSLSGCAAVAQLTDEAGNLLENSAGVNDVITADAPFRGSPSEKYADGAAGIAIPEATRVKWFSKTDVAWAYRKAKKLIEARHLDEQTLLGGRPTAYADQLHPRLRKEFLKYLDHKDQDEDTRAWVTSFAPGKVDLVGLVIKVQSTLSPSVKIVENRRELHVTHESRIVYAVKPKGKPGPIQRVMVYDKSVFEFWRERSGGRLNVWQGDHIEGWSANTRCDISDSFYHPDFNLTGSGGTGPAQDPYKEQAKPLKEGECGAVTGV